MPLKPTCQSAVRSSLMHTSFHTSTIISLLSLVTANLQYHIRHSQYHFPLPANPGKQSATLFPNVTSDLVWVSSLSNHAHAPRAIGSAVQPSRSALADPFPPGKVPCNLDPTLNAHDYYIVFLSVCLRVFSAIKTYCSVVNILRTTTVVVETEAHLGHSFRRISPRHTYTRPKDRYAPYEDRTRCRFFPHSGGAQYSFFIWDLMD